MRAALAVVGLLVLLVLPLLSCDGDEPSCEGQCLREPFPHCVTWDRCSRDDECPAGTACESVNVTSPADACFIAEEEGTFRCRPPRSSAFDAFRLQRGFQAAELDVVPDVSGPATLLFTAPPRANLVACALFSCQPDFADLGGEALSSQETLRKISTFATCGLVHGVVPAEAGAFDLTDPRFRYVPLRDSEMCTPDVPPGEPQPVPRRYHFTHLVAGCWAYDETRVVAASRLHRLEPSDLESLGIPSDATCPRDGVECYLTDTKRFGTCHGGECLSRCRTALDCEHAARADMPLEDVPLPIESRPCEWRCEREREDDVLGVCLPDTSQVEAVSSWKEAR
jgi:hypothetical protein